MKARLKQPITTAIRQKVAPTALPTASSTSLLLPLS
jgi:hypothetical protein